MINFILETKIKNIVLLLIYIIVGITVYFLIKKVINKRIKIEKLRNRYNKQRAETAKGLLLNIIKYLIIVIVGLAILSLLGVNIKSIAAGLGITTAIIGLAFQDFAKDFIAGFSIIAESQYEIGDIIEVDGFLGEVISLGLKTTKIRGITTGAIKIISNHNMDNIINYSQTNSIAVVDVGISYSNTYEQLENVVKELSKKLMTENPYALGELKIAGIIDFADSSIIYRIIQEVKSAKNIETERLIRKELKKSFDKAGIIIPYPQIEVNNGKQKSRL